MRLQPLILFVVLLVGGWTFAAPAFADCYRDSECGCGTCRSGACTTSEE